MNGGHLRAAALMRDRRYGDAIPLLIKACGAADADRRCWVDLGLCLIATEQHAGLFRLIETRHGMAGDGPRLFHDCLAAALVAALEGPLDRIIAATPRNSVLFVIALNISGVLDCRRDPAQGIESIKAASAWAQQCADEFAKDPILKALLYEGDVLETFDGISAIEALDRVAMMRNIDGVAAEAQFDTLPVASITAPFIFLSSCSEPYLDRFGAAIVRALDGAGVATVYHLHVVDPSPEIAVKIAKLQADCTHLDLRFSTEVFGRDGGGYSRASFYACSRLIRLPEIFAHYDRDVMMWDMDTGKINDLPRLVDSMRDADLGYFEMTNQRPALICHLAVSYFKNNAVTRRCAALISSYALVKLQQAPYWLLDQATLFCASRYVAAKAGLRINDFGINPGGAFESYVDVVGSAAEKQAMRKRAAA